MYPTRRRIEGRVRVASQALTPAELAANQATLATATAFEKSTTAGAAAEESLEKKTKLVPQITSDMKTGLTTAAADLTLASSALSTTAGVMDGAGAIANILREKHISPMSKFCKIMALPCELQLGHCCWFLSLRLHAKSSRCSVIHAREV